jgi:hypothetical protein
MKLIITESQLKRIINEEEKLKWTDEMLKKEADKYDDLSDFIKNSTKAYKVMVHRKILPKYTSHMKRKTKLWSDDDLRKESEKYTELKDFRTNSPEAYDRASKRGILPELTKNLLRSTTRIPYFFNDSELEQEAKKYEDLKDFRTKSERHYLASLSKGEEFFNRITSHLHRPYNFWTNDELEKEALKYDKVRDFIKNSPEMQSLSKFRGKDFYRKITSHMIDKRNPLTSDDTINKTIDSNRGKHE